VSLIGFVSWLFALTLATGQTTSRAEAGGQVYGRVLNDATFQPIANARVFLYPIPFPAGGHPVTAVTNDDGEYVFRPVRPGSYRLGTNKPGFLPAPGVEMPVVTLAVSEERRVDLTMSLGGVLAGRILDESGRPLKNVWVGALRVIGIADLNQALPSVAVARTNDLGEYRVEGLQSGQYVIVANPGHGPIGAAAGGITDSRTYFPGTLNFTKAQHMTVGPAQTVEGLDFKMATAPTFEVSGFAVDDAGRAVPDALVALNADWSLFGGLKGSSRTDSDGRFLFTRISAGDYMLTMTNPGNERKPVTRQTPFVRVNVVDADVSGLIIQLPIR
jgi:protocatechuate 3,4-dioxygenase beta subunit